MKFCECGVCGSTDENLYLRCNRPDCPDGRDRPWPAGTFHPPGSPAPNVAGRFLRVTALCGVMVAAATLGSWVASIYRAEEIAEKAAWMADCEKHEPAYQCEYKWRTMN